MEPLFLPLSIYRKYLDLSEGGILAFPDERSDSEFVPEQLWQKQSQLGSLGVSIEWVCYYSCPQTCGPCLHMTMGIAWEPVMGLITGLRPDTL